MSPALLKPILDCICPHSKTWCTWCRRTAVFFGIFIYSQFVLIVWAYRCLWSILNSKFDLRWIMGDVLHSPYFLQI